MRVCDFAQFESAFGLMPGGGATQYLARIMGRARALEVLLSAEDYDAELAEREISSESDARIGVKRLR